MISGVAASLAAGFAGSVLAGAGCAIAAGAYDVRRKDLVAAGVATVVLGLACAGSGLVANWIPAARVGLVVAVMGASVVSACGLVAARRGAPPIVRTVLWTSVACEVFLAVAAVYASGPAR